jgi:hypothetical protein
MSTPFATASNAHSVARTPQALRAGWLQRLAVTLTAIGLAVLVGGCNASYLREGAGLELASASVVQQTDLEDIYLGHLCRQAGLSPLGVPCDPTRGGSGAWALVTQAGMNDIDRRCDGYLAWIDAQKKNVGPVLQQITDVRNATTAILTASGAGGSAIGIVAAAFGLASNSFANVNSRLINELDNSTIQSIVLNRQQRFREQLTLRDIADRPAAVYVLRSYLRICMPFTIETEVNSTLTTLARTGQPPDARLALTSPRLAGSAVMSARPTLNSQTGSGRTQPQPLPGLEGYLARYFEPSFRRGLTPSIAQATLRKLCASDADIAAGSPRVAELVRIFKRGRYAQSGSDDPYTPSRGAAVTNADWRFINSSAPAENCGEYRNYFEKTMVAGGVLGSRGLGPLARYLGLPQLASGPAAPRTEEVRAAIRRARACLGSQIAWSSDLDELTPEIWNAMNAAQPGSCAAR